MKTVFLYLFMIADAGLGAVATLYLVVSLIGMLGFKVYRKVKYKTSMFD